MRSALSTTSTTSGKSSESLTASINKVRTSVKNTERVCIAKARNTSKHGGASKIFASEPLDQCQVQRLMVPGGRFTHEDSCQHLLSTQNAHRSLPFIPSSVYIPNSHLVMDHPSSEATRQPKTVTNTFAMPVAQAPSCKYCRVS